MSPASQPCLQRWLRGQPFQCHASQSLGTSSSCTCTRLLLLDMNNQRTSPGWLTEHGFQFSWTQPTSPASTWSFQSHSNCSPHDMVSQPAQAVTPAALRSKFTDDDLLVTPFQRLQTSLTYVCTRHLDTGYSPSRFFVRISPESTRSCIQFTCRASHFRTLPHASDNVIRRTRVLRSTLPQH